MRHDAIHSFPFQSFFSGKLFGKSKPALSALHPRMFQSFFSGKLFGKLLGRVLLDWGKHVSILLLWKVIWKVFSSASPTPFPISFNPSSLESYLESSSIALFACWIVASFNPSSLESYLERPPIRSNALRQWGFNPSSLESYLERRDAFHSLLAAMLFQSFFSGKLFGKIEIALRQIATFFVSILLLWKVIWKEMLMALPSIWTLSFNPSSLESYLERSKYTNHETPDF